MKVSEYLGAHPRKVVTVKPELLVRYAMRRLIENAISCLPVVAPSGALLGIISDKDIFRAAYEGPESFIEQKVEDLMSKDLIIGLPDDDFDYIGGVMTKNRIRHVPIMDGRNLVGLISVGDFVKAQLKSAEIENRYLKKFIKDPYPA